MKEIEIFTTVYVSNIAAKIKLLLEKLDYVVSLYNRKLTDHDISRIDKENKILFLLCVQWLTSDLSVPLPKNKYIIYQLEQLDRADNIHLNNTYMEELYENALFIFDYSKINLNYYNNSVKDKVSFLFPPVVNFKLKPPNKIYDVLFYGSVSPRRNQLLVYLTKMGINLKVVNNVFGAELQDLIGQSKIVLNVRYSDSQILETCRINEIVMSPDTYIVSEIPASIEFYTSIYKNRIKFVEFNFNKIFKLINTILKIYYLKKIDLFDPNIIDNITLSSLRLLDTM